MRYFQKDQLVFLVTHPAMELASQPQIDAVIAWANTQVKTILKADGVVIMSPEPYQKVSFTARGRAATGRLTINRRWRKKGRAEALPDHRARILHDAVSKRSVRAYIGRSCCSWGRGLNGMRTDDSLKKQLEKASLDQVSLNWVNSGANGGMGSGGPSAPPTPFTTPVGVPPPPIPYQFDVKNPALKQMLGHGQGVEVAILDTLPHNGALAMSNAYTAFNRVTSSDSDSAGQTSDRRVSLEAAILGYGPYDFALLLPFEIRDQPYAMPDHGLFVAGIIHSLVKDAKLHLIEVLNPFGVGDVQSIAEGFSIAISLVAGSGLKWVINCSLTLNAPANMDQLRKMIADLMADPGDTSPQDLADLLACCWLRGCVETLCRAITYLPGQAQGIENACNMLFPNSGVIAAAGNDTLKTGTLTPTGPRYPAISDSVVGVGALKGTTGGVFEAADYTNLADAPTSSGMTTFGGEPLPSKGVLGIYVDDIPKSRATSSECKWLGVLVRNLVLHADHHRSRGWAVERSATGRECASRDKHFVQQRAIREVSVSRRNRRRTTVLGEAVGIVAPGGLRPLGPSCLQPPSLEFHY